MVWTGFSGAFLAGCKVSARSIMHYMADAIHASAVRVREQFQTGDADVGARINPDDVGVWVWCFVPLRHIETSLDTGFGVRLQPSSARRAP